MDLPPSEARPQVMAPTGQVLRRLKILLALFQILIVSI